MHAHTLTHREENVNAKQHLHILHVSKRLQRAFWYPPLIAFHLLEKPEGLLGTGD